MTDGPKKRRTSTAGLITIPLLLILLYLASTGPAVYLTSRFPAWGSACNVIYWPVLPILVPAMEGRGSPFVAYWLYIWTPDSDKCLYELKYHDWYPDLFPEPPPGPLPPVDSEEFNFDD